MSWPAPDVIAGSLVPPLRRTFRPSDLVAYAGATWDWHRLHYDAAYAAARGMPGPVVDGQVLGALLVEALQDWLGPRAFVRKLGFRLRSPVIAGETVRCEGTVDSREDGLVRCSLRVVVVDEDGREARVAADGATAEVAARP